MDLREVRAMATQLKKVHFSACEEYLLDLIENEGYSPQEVKTIQLELSDLYLSSKKYESCLEILQRLLEQMQQESESQMQEVGIESGVNFFGNIVTQISKLVDSCKGSLKGKALRELENLLNDNSVEGQAEVKKLIQEILERNKINSGFYKIPPGLEQDAENIALMEQWIKEGGGNTKGLEVRFLNNVYRGVFLTSDAKVN